MTLKVIFNKTTQQFVVVPGLVKTAPDGAHL
ncbi:hypothetical protein HV560_03940 [Mannheimia pernigra]|uniref:Uncharacterized protein n=1 Tax=Mannheimia pernigra TaxID=111844 RepID=A0ABD7AAY6_9PAST|nr:hypothetical protein HV560_03940 [Mannheimia pernigra]QLB45356.1 hypothetical protein HV561_10485 [Mannheimia pernigra]